MLGGCCAESLGKGVAELQGCATAQSLRKLRRLKAESAGHGKMEHRDSTLSTTAQSSVAALPKQQRYQDAVQRDPFCMGVPAFTHTAAMVGHSCQQRHASSRPHLNGRAPARLPAPPLRARACGQPGQLRPPTACSPRHGCRSGCRQGQEAGAARRLHRIPSCWLRPAGWVPGAPAVADGVLHAVTRAVTADAGRGCTRPCGCGQGNRRAPAGQAATGRRDQCLDGRQSG